MKTLQLIVGTILVGWLCAGCVWSNEGSATANVEQIREHLINQMHCQELDLHPDGKDHFTGTGKTEGGNFSISVTRRDGRIVFEGVYKDTAGNITGNFNGSSSWYSHSDANANFHLIRESSATQSSTFR